MSHRRNDPARNARITGLTVLTITAPVIAGAVLLYFTELQPLAWWMTPIVVILLGHAVWEFVEAHRYEKHALSGAEIGATK